MAKIALRRVESELSWVLRSKDVELAVTRRGGQMAPVTFARRTRRPVRPYYVNPWRNEKLRIDDPVLRVLRGDFFCLPFGANAASYRGEQHCCHGETATASWSLADAGRRGSVASLVLTMSTKVRPGRVTKKLSLVDGQNIVYSSHVLEGFSGSAPLGHHATLAVPSKPGAMRIATSRFRFGLTPPTAVGDPTIGHYQSLAIGAKFNDLSHVPTLWKDQPWVDFTAFPAREGFTDFVATFDKPGADPAWTAAVDSEAGFLWFSMKDPRVLPTTAIWASNRGRHTVPWNGRNACLGLEDVCGYFAEGLAPSVRANELKRAGIPTAVKLSPKRPVSIHYIQGAVPVPRNFLQVKDVEFAPGQATFHAVTGKTVIVPVNHDFLRTGEPV